MLKLPVTCLFTIFRRLFFCARLHRVRVLPFNRCCFGSPCPPFLSQSVFVFVSVYGGEFAERLFFCSFLKPKRLFAHWMHSDWSFEVVSSCVLVFFLSLVFCFYWVDEQYLYWFVDAFFSQYSIRCYCLYSTRSSDCHFKHFIGFRNSYCFHLLSILSINISIEGKFECVQIFNPLIPRGWHESSFVHYT